MKLHKIKVLVNHEDCWTSNVNSVEYLQTINLQVYPDKNYLRSRIILNKDDYVKLLLREMKRHKSIINVNNVWKFEEKSNYYIIDFLNVYKGSIAGYLYDEQVLFLGNIITFGKEEWTFVTPTDQTSEVVNGLNSLGKVEKVIIKDFKPSLLPNLSEIELKVLKTAIEKGYLKYPRENDASKIASLLGMSKVTFLYHLRNIERKVLEYIMKFYDN
ncbi:MAG: helix-turn-helix domain-containing protein [Sulfolobaceae archaeon]